MATDNRPDAPVQARPSTVAQEGLPPRALAVVHHAQVLLDLLLPLEAAVQPCHGREGQESKVLPLIDTSLHEPAHEAGSVHETSSQCKGCQTGEGEEANTEANQRESGLEGGSALIVEDKRVEARASDESVPECAL